MARSRSLTLRDGLKAIGRRIVVVTLLVHHFGCDSAPEVILDGSSTVFPISRAAQEGYFREHPEVCVIVNNHGTGGGFGRYAQGEAEIVNASRTAKPSEIRKAEQTGRPWSRFTIAYDGVTVVVNGQNTWATQLSVDQLAQLWKADQPARTWRDLDPSWPERPVLLFGPDDDSGTYDFFSEAILEGGEQRRKGVQRNSDDNILIRGVARERDGLGYFGYAYYQANRQRLQAVAIRARSSARAIAPNPETIGSGDYRPLARPLFLYVSQKAILAKPHLVDFLDFYLDNLPDLAPAGGYVSPSVEDRQSNRVSLTRLIDSRAIESRSAAAVVPSTPTPSRDSEDSIDEHSR